MAACSSAKTATWSASEKLDVVKVAGTDDKTNGGPIKGKPLKVRGETTIKVITPDKGAWLSKANTIMFTHVLFEWQGRQADRVQLRQGGSYLDLVSKSLLPGLTRA